MRNGAYANWAENGGGGGGVLTRDNTVYECAL